MKIEHLSRMLSRFLQILKSKRINPLENQESHYRTLESITEKTTMPNSGKTSKKSIYLCKRDPSAMSNSASRVEIKTIAHELRQEIRKEISKWIQKQQVKSVVPQDLHVETQILLTMLSRLAEGELLTQDWQRSVLKEIQDSAITCEVMDQLVAMILDLFPRKYHDQVQGIQPIPVMLGV
ncbi:C protein [Salem virus]|uniref:C protein n=1 Tax=Salem virus TaxID=120499 RepID=Q9IZB9_9MONO|nr:C protein [Salem virus]AAF63743.1 C protein [Salem virus]